MLQMENPEKKEKIEENAGTNRVIGMEGRRKSPLLFTSKTFSFNLGEGQSFDRIFDRNYFY